ncbi:MAG TPA: hypothetical protein VE398_14515 [Acidobacteriota bacterium]|nr:hypothetical protein [Acidobacteriota bacterium]
MRGMFLLVPFLVQIAAAQQPVVPPGSDHEVIQQLLERVQQLEAEVRELKAQRAAATSNSPESASRPAASGTPSADVSSSPAPAQAMAPMTHPRSVDFAKMNFRGFSDVDFHATDRSGDTNTFALGQFNLFITSRLSDQLSFLAEAVIEGDQRNSVGVDLERLLLQYSASDYFNVSFGRYHTAIGWYNTAYHHSTWMQTAVGRPFLFEFEDKGGILPIHNVGISATGRIPSGELGLHYIAEIGNGRTSRSPLDEPVQNVMDENNGKALNFALLTRPTKLQGFEAGFSIYHDNLTPQGLPNIGQTIMAVHAIYQGPAFEWLNEGLLIRNSVNGTDRVEHTPGFYTQISHKLGTLRPYFRYQYVNVPRSDLVFQDVGLMHGPSVGIRYDFSEFAAFKLQYDRTERRNLGGFNGITTQLSFAF